MWEREKFFNAAYFKYDFNLFFLISKAHSDLTKKIVKNLEESSNYNFKFAQTINKKKETGKCILVFNRKINCKYDKSRKVLISDGENLIIRSNSSDNPSFYKLKNTSFYKILDKKYLIGELNSNKVEKKNEKIFIDLNYQNIDIKVFFDEENLYLKGWQTTDIYNNSVFTEIEIYEINKNVKKNLFDINEIN